MSQIGKVFDMQRCSLHDGPGIRTTVFLKGCPLRCQWCHNPESQSFKSEISFIRSKCMDCFSCVQACPNSAHQIINERHELRHELCRLCGNCVNACSFGALKIIGEDMDVESIISEVERDTEYYKRSGGGMTLTGGEPMAQYEFTREILLRAKEKGIHACLETCGFAPKEKYEGILPLTDLFLFDYKETDPVKHMELTGVSNELILENLDYLYNSGASILLRCPLVPGINDSTEHLKGIADISSRYPELGGIEIMAYHDMGKDKCLQIGKQAELAGIKTVGEEVKDGWLKILKGLGCERAIIG